MKMMSRTSTTSTSGVMLMSGVASPLFLLPPPSDTPTVLLLKFGLGQRLGRVTLAPAAEAAQVILELVQ